jgi:hypothetical protein
MLKRPLVRVCGWGVRTRPRGNHACYISKLSKILQCYLKWDIAKAFSDIFTELAQAGIVLAAKASSG